MKKHQTRRNPNLSDPEQMRNPNSVPSRASPVRNLGLVENGGPVPVSMTTDSNVQQENQSSEFRFLGFLFPRSSTRNAFISNAISLMHLRFQFLGLLGWILCLTFMIWAITATSMIETPVTTQLVTNATTLVPGTNGSVTEETPIFEGVCIKVTELKEIKPTVSLKARFQINHTITADGLFMAICDLIRSFSIFSGIYYIFLIFIILNSDTITNSNFSRSSRYFLSHGKWSYNDAIWCQIS